ncbi:hypothetical protein [Sinorhizobium alkalisoli]|uniref:DUF883 domain-containing protein n=1 Tax=Sinorhizobium alkalisoli TaxID=1752398 RepID=A0A1E3VEX0_9HYPH|nr:hypothetical protein [Sinorhizobium alkalisoli]ODR91651.1 hypothetical protein A8M32_09420 [Sinorhizobium alkalisoli]
MATGLFSSSSTRKHTGGSGETSIQDQLDEIRNDVGKLVALLADRGLAASEEAKARAQGARARAATDLEDLLASGEQMLSELRGRYADTERQLRTVVREHPVATLGTAAVIGLIAAAVLRR